MRENRTRGGRNKFGPIYRRDRALRRQLHMQRLHSEGPAVSSYLNDKFFLHDFASASQDADVKPTKAELAFMAAQSPSSSSLRKDRDFMFGRHQLWRHVHHSASCSAGNDFTQMPFPLSGRQTSDEVVDPLNQQSIGDIAAVAAAGVFDRQFAADQNQISRGNFLHRQQTYPSSGNGWQFRSAPPVPASSYSFVPQPSCESSSSASANYSSGFSQNARSEFTRKLPGETVEMPKRCHYLQQTDRSGVHPQYSASDVMVLQHRTGVLQEQGVTGVSREPGMHTYHHYRHSRHHPQYSHNLHQQHRSGQQQPQLASSPMLYPEVKQSQQDAQSSHSSDCTSPEFINEADIAAQRLPGALKLINDLQRHDPRLHDSIDQLRCCADDLIEQLQNSVMGNGENGPSLELDSAAVTREMIVMACQLCDQALFVLVEWARHAHFFRQLPVSSLYSILSRTISVHLTLIGQHFCVK